MRKTITIGDLGTIITGKTPPTTNKNYYGDYAVFIKPTDISEQSKYTYETEEMYSKLAAEKYESSLIPKGAICVPCIGTIGTKMTMAPCDCYTNQSINSIVCNENYDNEYVYYLIKNFLPGLKAYNLGTASGREYVSKSNFEKIELVAEQNKTIQKRIGVILSRYDSLIENYQKQINLLEEAAQRLYKEWFVDLHFPGHENTKIVDGVPEGWEKKKLVEIADIVMGQSPKSEYYNNEFKGLPFHQGVGSYGNRFVVDNRYSTSFTRIAEPNSVLFSVRAPVGRLNITKNKVVIGRGLAAMTHKEGYQSYLFYLLKERFFKDNIIGNGAIFASISKNELHNLDFITPTDDLAIQFNTIAGNLDDEIMKADTQICLLTEARDRLLPKLMNGEIKV